jgi:hypothetical protein
MSPQPLTFLNTLPALITAAPPVIGVSSGGHIKVVMMLDYQLVDAWIHPRLLQSPHALRMMFLQTIDIAQKIRNVQVHELISQHSHIARLSIWDVEATLLSIKNRQVATSGEFQGVGRNHLMTMIRNHQGEITRFVLNSSRHLQQQQLERSILSAAQQSFEQIRSFQKVQQFPYLAAI